ncbi:MAG: hypothetical protein ACTSQO_00545 [Candidatus Helarchaeota archaeon]
MSTISDRILVHELKSYCKKLDLDNYILNYFYCKKRRYHVNPKSFCKFCPYYE